MEQQKQMFEKTFQRPHNFFELPAEEQYKINKNLGLLNWKGMPLSEKDKQRFQQHYKK